MARIIGTVKSISGKAAVKTLNDQLHVLKVGDTLEENALVSAIGADSKVTLTLEGGRELTLNGNDEILLDKSVFTALEEGESLDVKALQQALAETLTPENMEETAAGQEVVSDANAGAEYADRNDARGNPSSYLTGTESAPLAVTFASDTVQALNTNPDAMDDSYNPEAENDALSTPEDSSLTIAPSVLLSNDSDIDGNPLSITGVQDATNGTVSLVDGNIIFTPNPNYNGPATFTYTISDGEGGSDTATVNINVTPINDPAEVGTATENLTETDEPLSVSGVLSISDFDSPETFNASVIQGAYGEFSIDANGNWNYVTNDPLNWLNAGDTVSEIFSVSSSDGTPSSVTINITGSEDVSTITSATANLTETNAPLTTGGTLVVSDLDTTDATVVPQTTNSTYGTFSINSAGVWSYTTVDALNQLDAGQAITEVFNVATSDGGANIVTINITGSEDVSTITSATANLTETNAPLTTGGTLVVSDLDTTDATVVPQTTNSTYGTFSINSAGVWSYTTVDALNQLDAGQAITEVFNVATSDGGTNTVTINILGTNDAPIAVDDAGTTDVITYTSAWNYDLNVGNDYTNDNVTITSMGGEGFLVDGSGPTMGVDGLSNDSAQQIDPGEGIQFVFNDDIKLVLINLGNFNSIHDTVTWVLKDGDTIIDPSDYTATFNILQNGNYGDILTINSTVAFDTLQITNDDSNTSSFSIDQLLASNSGTTTITEGSLLYFSEENLLANDTDIEGNTLNIIGVDDSATFGTVTMDTNGNILYDPTDAYDSITEPTIDTFSYTISDGNGGTSTAEVSVTLLPSTGTTFLGDILLIDGDHTIDLSNISGLLSSTNSTIGQIDMKNGDATILNVSPDHVSTISDGTLYVNGDAGDSIDLSGSWSLAADQLAGYDSYSSSVSGNDVFLHVDEEVSIIP